MINYYMCSCYFEKDKLFNYFEIKDKLFNYLFY